MLSLEEYQKLPESWVVYRAVGRAVSGGRAVYRDMYWAVRGAFGRGFPND